MDYLLSRELDAQFAAMQADARSVVVVLIKLTKQHYLIYQMRLQAKLQTE